MTLRKIQSKFAQMVGLLITHIYLKGYECTLGDASRIDRRGHCTNSKHYTRRAIDINLFLDGVYLTSTESHAIFGEYWESLGGTWGGRFKNPDGNHYQY